MSTELRKTARALVAEGKGILAADESDTTIKKRFDSIGLESTEENRRAYRDMLFTTPGVEEYISGVILFDETIRQSSADGTPFPKLLASKGIIPGIKVDKGAKPLPLADGETITEGLDGLRERLAEYRGLGARFGKWRATYSIGDALPSEDCAWTNAHALARYAALCQEAVPGIVFLSGGQSDEDATAHLNAMNARGPHPWQLSFSYGRALQAPALKAWGGKPENVEAGQQAYYHRAKMNSAARTGMYAPEMEREAAVV